MAFFLVHLARGYGRVLIERILVKVDAEHHISKFIPTTGCLASLDPATAEHHNAFASSQEQGILSNVDFELQRPPG